MTTPQRTRVIRDPLWNTIRLDSTAVRIIDTTAFQRLRYIRQLGFAHLVYPGATHTRFDHAVGVYHLTTTALRLLRERGGTHPKSGRTRSSSPTPRCSTTSATIRSRTRSRSSSRTR